MSRLLVSCFLCLLFSVAAIAQLPTSSLNGTVTDPQGGLVAGGKVAVVNNAPRTTREPSPTRDGGFSVADLPPGDYTVRVSASGFATSEYKGVRLEVGR